MEVMALVSGKGGVGKTATAVNLSACAALAGRTVLLVDLDPQGASGFQLRIATSTADRPRRFWTGKQDLSEAIRGSDHSGLDVLPADAGLRRSEAVLEGLSNRRRRLSELLEPCASDYDLVVLDCPPGNGLLTENVVRAADLVLVPVMPAALSIRTMLPLRQLAGKRAWRIRPFISMRRTRDASHDQIVADLRSGEPALLATEIPLATQVERMAVWRKPLPYAAPRSQVAKAYGRLWLECAALLDGEAGESP